MDDMILVDLQSQWTAVVHQLEGISREQKLAWLGQFGEIYGRRHPLFGPYLIFYSTFGLVTLFQIDAHGEMTLHSGR